MKAIIIEPDKEIRVILFTIMASLGWSIDTTECLKTARELLLKNKYDVILADHYYIKITHSLNLLIGLKNVVILSSWPHPEKDFPKFKILNKPFEIEDFEKIIQV